MTSPLTTLPPVTHHDTKTLLASGAFTCTLLTLDPGDETPHRDAHDVQEHLLFVIEGEVTVRSDLVTTILGKDQAMHIAAGRAHVIAAHPASRAKLLRVELAPQPVVAPPLRSFDS